MITLQFGDVFERKNEKTGKVVFYDDMSRDTIINCYSKNYNDSYEIEIHGLEKIEHDSRDSSIKITHLLENGSKHGVRLVLDCNHTHEKQKEIHLNFTNDSKEVLKDCKLCWSYFEYLNHKEIITMKIKDCETIDADFIWEQIKENLRKDLLRDYYCSQD